MTHWLDILVLVIISTGFLPGLAVPTQNQVPTAAITGLDVYRTSIADIHRQLFVEKTLTVSDVVQVYLGRIAKYNGELRAVYEVNPDARSLASRADRKLAHCRSGKGTCNLGQLFGIPVLVKDNIATTDRMNTTAGCLGLLDSRPKHEADVITRLREEGAIILGKAAMSEWAHFRSDFAPSGWSSRGQVVNPWDPDATPGGSSSGCGAAIASGMAPVCLGTETLGSILSPSIECRVTGFKPAPGSVSVNHVIPITRDEDVVGPICMALPDCALVYGVISKNGFRVGSRRSERYRIGYARGAFGAASSTLPFLKSFARVIDLDPFVNMDDFFIPWTSSIMPHLYCGFRDGLNTYLGQLSNSKINSLRQAVDYSALMFNTTRMPFEVLQGGINAPTYRTNYSYCMQMKRQYRAAGLKTYGRLFQQLKLDVIVSDETISSLSGSMGYAALAFPFRDEYVAFTAPPGKEAIMFEIGSLFYKAEGPFKHPPKFV